MNAEEQLPDLIERETKLPRWMTARRYSMVES
jgi:hypothetical protein